LEGQRHQHEQESLVGGVEEKPLVSGVEEFYMKREDPIVYPTPPPALSWISGRDPLLVVSIVTTQKNPQLDNCLLFFFFRVFVASCIIMHLSPCMLFLKLNII
jgi:hypothetical protein